MIKQTRVLNPLAKCDVTGERLFLKRAWRGKRFWSHNGVGIVIIIETFYLSDREYMLYILRK